MNYNNKKNININNHILNTITPMAIEFHKSYFWFGELLGKILLVTNYPTRVSIGWLSKIANMEGVTCSIHMNPANSAKLIENISKSMGELSSRISDGGSALAIKRAEQQYDDANKLLEKIDREQENVFYVTIAIMITASEKDELERKARNVESSIAGSKMKCRTAMFNQEDGLLAVSPYGLCPDTIRSIASRNMPTSTIAGAFPFNSSGLNDGKGWILGKDNAGGIILIDTWKRGNDRTNTNWTITGSSGMGKSATVKHIFLNEYAQGTKIIIIDPEREYKELCENLDGKWINCGGGKGGRINPLQIKDNPDDESDSDNNNGSVNNVSNPLALHFQTLRTFFKLYMKDLNNEDLALLEESLELLYKDFNITFESDLRNLKQEDYPVISDLYKLLIKKSNDKEIMESRREKYKKLSLLLRSASIGADSALWDGYTTIEADSDFIVLDTHNLQESDDTIRRTQYFNILTWAWQQLSSNREEKVLLGVDEAYLVVDPDVPQALQFLRNVSKRIRKYNGGLAVITQSVVDFLDPAVRRHGQALLDNPCYKLFMGIDGKDLEELSNIMGLTEAEQEMLAKKKRGHGLLVAGSKRLHAVIQLSDYELKLFGTGGGK